MEWIFTAGGLGGRFTLPAGVTYGRAICYIWIGRYKYKCPSGWMIALAPSRLMRSSQSPRGGGGAEGVNHL